MVGKIQKTDVNSLRIEKALIFDSSSIITLAMSNLLSIVSKLKNVFNGSFLVPYDVFHESVVRPLNIKRFEFEAMMIKKLIDDATDAIKKYNNNALIEIISAMSQRKY